MYKILVLLLMAAMPMAASAQLSKMPQRNEIVTLDPEGEGSDVRLEVFQMVKDGQSTYILSVGHLGVGTDVFQVSIDPIFELFIPLGSTLDEAIETMTSLQALYKQPKGTSMEVQGCLDWALPGENLETVTVTFIRPLLSRKLEFSVKRGEMVRATYVSRSDFRSLVSGLKFYRKLHPKG